MSERSVSPASQQLEHDQLWNGTRREGPEPSPRRPSFAGNLFSKLTGLRQTESSLTGNKTGKEYNSGRPKSDAVGTSQGSLRVALQQHRKTRKRKGSLRKTALLGNGAFTLESRMVKSSSNRVIQLPPNEGNNNGDYGREPRRNSSTSPPASGLTDQFCNAPRETVTKRSSSSDHLSQLTSWEKTNDDVLQTQQDQFIRPSLLTHDAEPGWEQTVDDDDPISMRSAFSNAFSLSRRRASRDSILSSRPIQYPHFRPVPTPSSSSDSYAPAHIKNENTPTSRMRAGSTRVTSPPVTSLPGVSTSSEAWDYSETEWWGWIILIVTWLVFVIGMGSCLGVWSWAWDVGETPYAPPELEDDPTLPIVGYYPALLTLTAVMAWVWVIIAWVGMKYFRHAKIAGEDF